MNSGNRMRKLCLSISVFLMLLPLSAAVFPGYDFTFSRTITDSLMVMDSKKVGIDYTGYGFIGPTASGIYMRAGIQAPIYSIEMLLDRIGEERIMSIPDQNADPEKIKEKLETSFMFSMAIGPALRSQLTDSLQWYMGMGLSGKLNYANRQGIEMSAVAYFDIEAGVSFDMGFRFDLQRNTTLKIGINAEAALFAVSFLTHSSGKEGNSLLTKPSLVPYIFLPDQMKNVAKATGYISLGHTFRSARHITEYRYSTKSRITGNGILEPIR